MNDSVSRIKAHVIISHHWFLVLSIVALLGFSLPSMAGLTIGIYNNDAWFVASDSMVTYIANDGTEKTYIGRKVFQTSDSHCVSIANNYGGFVRATNTGKISLS
jgi:hypothetical protein